jgi:hypothetical protein
MLFDGSQFELVPQIPHYALFFIDPILPPKRIRPSVGLSENLFQFGML